MEEKIEFRRPGRRLYQSLLKKAETQIRTVTQNYRGQNRPEK